MSNGMPEEKTWMTQHKRTDHLSEELSPLALCIIKHFYGNIPVDYKGFHWLFKMDSDGDFEVWANFHIPYESRLAFSVVFIDDRDDRVSIVGGGHSARITLWQLPSGERIG